jgi:hypothetical protein
MILSSWCHDIVVIKLRCYRRDVMICATKQLKLYQNLLNVYQLFKKNASTDKILWNVTRIIQILYKKNWKCIKVFLRSKFISSKRYQCIFIWRLRHCLMTAKQTLNSIDWLIYSFIVVHFGQIIIASKFIYKKSVNCIRTCVLEISMLLDKVS